MPWTTVTNSGRVQRPPLSRTLYGVERMPRLLCPGRPSWMAAALRNHPLQTPSRRREYATPAMTWTTVTDSGRAQRPPLGRPARCRTYATLARP
eukprot:8090872-Pyramimonas_sp.AAC.1